MTDKTKPWLACKKAGLQLYDELQRRGLKLTGVGVSTTDDNKKVAINVMLLRDGDKSKVPTSYGGFHVKITITGPIVAL
jgi:hypothetical protein